MPILNYYDAQSQIPQSNQGYPPPAYNYYGAQQQGYQPGQYATPAQPSMFSGLGQLAGGLMGMSSQPYRAAERSLSPYLQAGTQGLGQYQNMLNQYAHPSEMISQLMGQYQESPYQRFLQQEAMRSGQNEASAQEKV